ncbi:Transcriptional activator protein acu-15 [Lachnellula cervina]|uniref:Transcriptional activator protein acu-15 n=1 Tax=Lachnellula cervina TaxID=1316786 RepID=A0A7D8UPX5_9HELO|nr:Transcriptional activator protein acu-15 [Lachnellula cervina]
MPLRRSTSSQLQTQLSHPEQGQIEQSPYNTTPFYDILRRDYLPSRVQGVVVGGGGFQYRCSYQTATATATVTAPSIKQEDATMPGKRTASGEPDGTPVKQPKTDRPEEFSKQVRTKLQTSSRTGQACDRCKVRKIRCDGLPGGCSPCLANNTECRTTDRITGRATQRGYVEGLEHAKHNLELRVRELEQKCIQNGVDIKPSNEYHDAAPASFAYNQQSSAQAPAWSPATSAYVPRADNVMPSQQQSADMLSALPNPRVEGGVDDYLGVSMDNLYLSEIKGTALSILGMTIDIADFQSDDMDEPDKILSHQMLYNKSYQAFLQSTLNINPRLEGVELPPKDEAFMYSMWYFRVINPYVPLLHKPTFMKLLTSWYDDPTFRPSIAETVMVHMVFAIMFFQYATRNREDPEQHRVLTHTSNKHYHYSLSFFYQLCVSHTAKDAQALTLICVHLRNFPKPGASWLLTQITLSLLIELGLHRSAKKWVGEMNPPNPLEVEMRKRTFWTLLTIHVTLAGKLGRPMAFRYEDFDCEIPEEVDDELLSENGLDTTRPAQCLHKIGLHGYRIVPLFIDMFNTIYAVRRQPDNYMPTVHSLEAKLETWKAGYPPELLRAEPGEDEQERRIFSLYTETWEQEFRLLLRHPSVAGTTDTAFRSESMRLCVASSRQMLRSVQQLHKYKSLDTTWYQSAVFVLAITTTLFSQWEKRSDLTATDIMALREEMDSWLEIISEVGFLLGSGMRLRDAVRNVTEQTLGLLSRALPNRNSFAQNNLKKEKSPSRHSVPPLTSTYSKPSTYSFDNTTSNGNGASVSAYIPAEDHLPHQQTPYPQATQYQNYAESASSTYTPHENHPYTPYPASGTQEAPLLAGFATQASQIAPDTWQRRDSQIPSSSSQAWHQWANTLTNSLDPQESYSANALMQLGAGDIHTNVAQTSHDMATSSAEVMDQGQLAGQVQWPLNVFDIGAGAGGGGRESS